MTMPLPLELWTNQGQGIVPAGGGGTTTPAMGATETWTVNPVIAFPQASNTGFPATAFYFYDQLNPGETMQATVTPGGLGAGQTWTVVRGADGSTPVSHSAFGFPIAQCMAGASYRALQNRGLLWVSGGGSITLADINAVVSAGYPGLWMNPQNVWDLTGLVISGGLQNFEFCMAVAPGSIGWNGHVSSGPGYIKTDTGGSPPADGIQVYASNPSGSQVQGIIFRNCVIKGSNSNTPLHFGGGERACGLVDTLCWNPGTATGSYGCIIDCALSANNAEDHVFNFAGGGGIAGGYNALGIDTASSGAHANDSVFYSPRTSAGNISVVKQGGGGILFIGAYDRSNPSVCNYQNNGGSRWKFTGGEHQNTAGQIHQVTAGTTVLDSVALTVTTGGATSAAVSGTGKLQFRQNCVFNTSQVITLAGTGVVDLSDPATDCTNLSVSNSAGTTVLAPAYPGGGRPAITSTGPAVNTSGQTIPRDFSLLAWTCPTDLAAGGSFQPVTQTIYLAEFWVYEALTIAHAGLTFAGGTATLTAGCFAGIYTAGATNFTNLATTTDQSASWTGSTGNKSAALTASLTPGVYYAALLLTGTSLPTVRAAAGIEQQLGNINLSGATLRCMIGATGQTSLATLPVSGFNATAPLFGMVFW